MCDELLSFFVVIDINVAVSSLTQVWTQVWIHGFGLSY